MVQAINDIGQALQGVFQSQRANSTIGNVITRVMDILSSWMEVWERDFSTFEHEVEGQLGILGNNDAGLARELDGEVRYATLH